MTKKLLFGGFVILTFPDACTILKKVRERASKNQQKCGPFIYDNQYFSIKFNDLKFSKNKVFGLKYGFYLENAIGE